MTSHKEVEVKFRVDDVRALTRKLRAAGFRQITPRTHEMNTLYDLPGQPLRHRGELLRLRRYGKEWLLTHKAKGKAGRHKMREETETKVNDGKKMDAILRALGSNLAFAMRNFARSGVMERATSSSTRLPLGTSARLKDHRAGSMQPLVALEFSGVTTSLKTMQHCFRSGSNGPEARQEK